MECKECGEESETFRTVKVGSKRRKVCEDCADRMEAEGEIAEAAEDAMRGMMEYKGKR